MSKAKDTIETMLNNMDKVESTSLKSALVDYKKERDEEQKNRALSYLRFLSDKLEERLRALRDIRKAEKRMKKSVQEMDALIQDFSKDGDIESSRERLTVLLRF